LMQNAGLMNSCNGLTTTGLQFGIPILLLVYYAGDMGDNAFHMLGLVTEPVLQGLGIKYAVVMDNEFRIWRAYNNVYWPALYLVDKKGVIRYQHAGEGAYDETDRVIKQLLEEN